MLAILGAWVEEVIEVVVEEAEDDCVEEEVAFMVMMIKIAPVDWEWEVWVEGWIRWEEVDNEDEIKVCVVDKMIKSQ